MSLEGPMGRATARPESRPAGRPFSPFLRLVIGVGATALAAEWARFQADLSWAALPVGAGAVITLTSVARGVRERRAWRRACATAEAQANAAAAAGATAGAEGYPIPAGRPDATQAGAPRTVQATRREALVGPAPAASSVHDASAQDGTPRTDGASHDTHAREATAAASADDRPTKEVSR